VPFDRSATRGRGLREIFAAYAAPISANATRSSGVASSVAPTSRMSEKGSSFSPRRISVGYTVPSAARRTPGISLNDRAQASTDAPVFPAETSASASPCATRRVATRIDASGRAASASDGFASIAITSGAWWIWISSAS
jgi:hypothetical protein